MLFAFQMLITVLPYGLKKAPSIFQKSMVQIFQPILHSELIYIDDILLFSGTQDDHRHLLNQFFDIIQSHGIILSAKKSTIATNNIEFRGMIIKYGHYQPGKHMAQELIHFPDQYQLYQLYQGLSPSCCSLYTPAVSLAEKESTFMERQPHTYCHNFKANCAKSATIKAHHRW